MLRADGLESREQKRPADSAGQTRAEVRPVQTGARAKTRRRDQYRKGQAMSALILFAVVVALEAVFLLAALALGR